MAQTITTALQLTYQLASSEIQSVADQVASHNVTVGTGWFRGFVAPDTGAVGAASTSPSSFCGYFKALLNTGAGGSVYTIVPDANGFVTIKYTGTGTSVITWHANHIVRNLLGFTGSTLTIPTGTTQTATYHPTHTWYMVGRRNDTNWQVVSQRRAIAELEDGTTYGWQSGRQRLTRTFDAMVQPIDWSTRSSLSLGGTPWLPDSTTRRLTPDATAGVAPPWSVMDTFAGGMGNALGCLFGNYQSAITGGVSTFDRCHFTSEFLNSRQFTEPSQQNNSNHVNVKGVGLWYVSTDSF